MVGTQTSEALENHCFRIPYLQQESRLLTQKA